MLPSIMNKEGYFKSNLFFSLKLELVSRTIGLRLFFSIFIILYFINLQPIFSQYDTPYEVVPITFHIPQLGSYDILVLIHNEKVYIPIKDFFDLLKIKNVPSSDYRSVSGFFTNMKNEYKIDGELNQINYKEEIFGLENESLILDRNTLFLEAAHFGQVFGLNCRFNFRSLSIRLETELELPIIKELRRKKLRHNLQNLLNEKSADTIVENEFSYLRTGVADWAVTATQQTNSPGNVRASLSLGGIALGAETDVKLYYDNRERFNLGRQFYRWKYVNERSDYLSQISIGNVNSRSTSSIFAPVRGLSLTNSPATQRQSFGTYQINDITEPGTVVELYVNDILIAYTKADSTGYYSFEVPLIYGNSSLRFQFYGPWGEEHMEEKHISIPFNFVPSGRFEYTITGGKVLDQGNNNFLRADFNYGLLKWITLGGGMEYLSSANSGYPMPFMNMSTRLGSNLIISGDYTIGARAKAVLNYQLPSGVRFNLEYLKYEKGQDAIFYNYEEERKGMLYIPIRAKKFTAFSRIMYNQIVFPGYQTTNAEVQFSAAFSRFSSSLTTNSTFVNSNEPWIYSNWSFTYRDNKGIRLTSQLQYEYGSDGINALKAEVEKRLYSFGFASVSYEKNMFSNTSFLGVNLRLNLSFLQLSISERHNDEAASFTQSASGSLLYSDESNHMVFNDQHNTGRGGVILRAFLDSNGNGIKDRKEPEVPGLKLKSTGGNIREIDKSGAIYVFGLPPYTHQFIELDEGSFEHISWKLKKSTLSVNILPNYFTEIDIPVSVLGEVTGMVFEKFQNGMTGIGRITLNIYNKDSKSIGQVTTESDGFFSFFGLPPGSYTIAIDNDQLNKLNLKGSPAASFKIEPGIEGDYVEGIEFVLENTGTELN